MNLFFGRASRQRDGSDRMCRVAAQTFERQPSRHSSHDGSMLCGFFRDDHTILGIAEEESCFLIYSGYLQRPLPGWATGSPLDDSDRTAEYLLARYRELGTGFLAGVHGQYVIAVCDGGRSTLVLATDPGGYRRLFYCLDKRGLAYSTNLVAICGALENGVRIDRTLEDFQLGYEFLPWGRTLFEGVRSSSGGELLVFRDGILSEQPHPAHEKDLEPIPPGDEDGMKRRLRDELMNALEHQAPSEERVAVLLGGVDSALVASALTEMGKKVGTFTFHFPDSRFNQQHTDTLSRFCGTEHTWVEITPDILRKGLSEFALTFNQPASQAHYLIQTAHACTHIRAAGYRHCFSGDGCDEIFLGYPAVYQRARFFGRLGVLPKPLVRLLSSILSLPLLEDRFGHVGRLARNVVTVAGRAMPVRGHIANRILDETSLRRLRAEDAPPQEMAAESILEQLARGLEGLGTVQLAYRGKSAVGLNKTRNDGCISTSGISIQSPFQYPALVRFVRSLSQEYLRPREGHSVRAVGKHILLQMVEGENLLPREIIYQPKGSPVTAPVDEWYTGVLRGDLLAALDDLPFDYDRAYVESMLRPKLIEALYRRYHLGKYASHAVSMLVTYAAFTKFGSRDRVN